MALPVRLAQLQEEQARRAGEWTLPARPGAALQQRLMGVGKINTQLPLSQVVWHWGVCSIPPVVILQLPTVVTHLIRYPLLVSFPLLTHFLILLLAFPAISSQLNYLHSNSCSRVGGTPPKTYAYTAELVHQTKSLSHPQTVSEARRTGLNTSEFPWVPQTASFLKKKPLYFTAWEQLSLPSISLLPPLPEALSLTEATHNWLALAASFNLSQKAPQRKPRLPVSSQFRNTQRAGLWDRNGIPRKVSIWCTAVVSTVVPT